MTTSNVPDTEINEQASGTSMGMGPGKRLQEARTSQQMSREDVAKHLHLDLKIIVALEENRFDSLSAPIFVKGYLRAYSRLLNLPADEILASYDQLGIGAPPPVINQPAAVEGLKSEPVAMPPRMFMYIGAAAVLLLPLVLWMMGIFGGGKPIGKEETPAQESADLISSMELALPPSMEESTAVAPAAPAPVTTVPPAKPAAPPVVVKPATVAPVTPPQAVKPPAPAVTSPPPKAAAPVASVRPAVPVAPVTTPAKPPASVAAGEGSITMTFSESVWVEVTDATGKRLIYSLGTKGETKTAQGVPPLKVGIGHVPGVVVEFNGKPFNYSRYVERGVAKFSLGEPGKSGNR